MLEGDDDTLFDPLPLPPLSFIKDAGVAGANDVGEEGADDMAGRSAWGDETENDACGNGGGMLEPNMGEGADCCMGE